MLTLSMSESSANSQSSIEQRMIFGIQFTLDFSLVLFLVMLQVQGRCCWVAVDSHYFRQRLIRIYDGIHLILTREMKNTLSPLSFVIDSENKCEMAERKYACSTKRLHTAIK